MKIPHCVIEEGVKILQEVIVVFVLLVTFSTPGPRDAKVCMKRFACEIVAYNQSLHKNDFND